MATAGAPGPPAGQAPGVSATVGLLAREVRGLGLQIVALLSGAWLGIASCLETFIVGLGDERAGWPAVAAADRSERWYRRWNVRHALARASLGWRSAARRVRAAAERADRAVTKRID